VACTPLRSRPATSRHHHFVYNGKEQSHRIYTQAQEPNLTRPLLSAVLLSLTACTDLGPEYESNQNLTTSGATTSSITTSSTETASTPTTTTETSTFSPMSGTWDNTEISFKKDGCGLDSEKMEPLKFSLNPVDASSFLLQQTDDELFWECASSGNASYECTSYVVTEPQPSWDATLQRTFTPVVRFDSEVSATMFVDYTTDCLGADCAYLSDLNGWSYPCLTELNLTLEHTGS
jgi:hypothetical protein